MRPISASTKCYWPMPFTNRAPITLSNDSKEHKVRNLYYYVDYEKVPVLPPDTACFHTQYRQEFPAESGQNYLLFDTAIAGMARLRLGTMPEGGIWSVALDDKTIEGLSDVDLYSSSQREAREVRIGMVNLAVGEHTLSFECKGRHPAAWSCWLGLDVLAIDAITPCFVEGGTEKK